MKKLLAMLLVVLMLGSMSAAAFADGEGGPAPSYVGQIKITDTNANHTYQAYQIFTGVVTEGATGDGTIQRLTDIRWGSNVSDAGKQALCEKYHVTIASGNADDYPGEVAAKLAALENANAGKELAVLLTAKDASGNFINITGTPKESSKGNPAIITPDAQGYYLVIDTPNSLNNVESSSYTENILVVVGASEQQGKADVTVQHKNSVPEMIKKVNENGSLEGTVGEMKDKGFSLSGKYNDVGDFEIGEEIEYELVASLPTELTRYNFYNMHFTDTMNGMTYVGGSVHVIVRHANNDVNVVFDGTIASNSASDDLKTIYINLNMTRNSEGNLILPVEGGNTNVDAGSTIIVRYKAKLDATANVGSAGNKNTAHLEFSNDPNNIASYGKTPTDTNIVYTYALDIIKQNAETKEKLAGAGFKLQRRDTGKWAIFDTAKTIPDPDHEGEVLNVVNKYVLAGWAATEDGGTEIFTINQGADNVKIVGPDEAHYYLKETTAPNNYNKLSDKIEFVIETTSGNTQNYPGNITTLTNMEIKITDPQNMSAGVNNGKGNVADGTVGIAISNNATAQLPTTGGIGTTMFYVIGATLAIGAVILLVVKRRMSVEDM